MSNAKQIFILMVEFDDDYGRFPCDATADVHKRDGIKGDYDEHSFKGEFSNDYLGQFIAAGYVKSEEIFVVPWEKSPSRKADNIITPHERVLEAGECGFSYVKNQSASDNAGRPLLLASMTGEGLRFNSDIYKGKMIVLRIDGSVRSRRLQKDGYGAKTKLGETLFEGGEGSAWEEGGFDLANLVHPRPILGELESKPSFWVMGAGGILALGVVLGILTYRRKRGRKKGKTTEICEESSF